MTFLNFLTAQVLSAAAFAAIVGWVSSLTSKRIIHAWERQHERDGDVLRSELARVQTVLSGAMQTFSAGQQAAGARRLQVAEEMWGMVLQVARYGSSAGFAYSIPNREWLITDGGFRELLVRHDSDTDIQFMHTVLTRNDDALPFMGEEFHTLLVTYTALVSGMVSQVRSAAKAGTFTAFQPRAWIKHMPAHTLSAVGVTEDMDDNQAAAAVKRRLAHIVAASISGERSATQSFEHASEILSLLRSSPSASAAEGKK